MSQLISREGNLQVHYMDASEKVATHPTCLLIPVLSTAILALLG